MHIAPHPHPHHAILNLEGGSEEVVHIRAFGKDMKIEIRVDESKANVVISTPRGLVSFPIPGSRNRLKDADRRERVKRA
jgi:hypothetical protein